MGFHVMMSTTESKRLHSEKPENFSLRTDFKQQTSSSTVLAGDSKIRDHPEGSCRDVTSYSWLKLSTNFLSLFQFWNVRCPSGLVRGVRKAPTRSDGWSEPVRLSQILRFCPVDNVNVSDYPSDVCPYNFASKFFDSHGLVRGQHENLFIPASWLHVRVRIPIVWSVSRCHQWQHWNELNTI